MTGATRNYPPRTGATQRAIIDVLRSHGGALNSTALVSEVWPRIANNTSMNPDVNTVLAAAWRLAQRGVVHHVAISGGEICAEQRERLTLRELLSLQDAHLEHPTASTFWILVEQWQGAS